MRHKKFINIFILVAIIILVLLLVHRSKADDSYGSAYYSRSDCYPTDNIVSDWHPMITARTGDHTQGLGSFESYTGTEGGCTNCPEGFTCTCADGNGSADVDDDTTIWYDFDTAVSNVLTGTTSSTKIQLDECITVAEGEHVQASFWGIEEAGTTDIDIVVARYADAVCGGLANVSGTIATGINMTTTWTEYGGSYRDFLGYRSYRVYVTETCDGGCTSVIDKLRVYSVGAVSSKQNIGLTTYNNLSLSPENLYKPES